MSERRISYEYISGVVFAILITLAFSATNFTLEMEFHTLIIKIIPFGAIIVGVACMLGFVITNKLRNTKNSIHQTLTGVLLGILSFVGIFWCSYKTIYISDGEDVIVKYSLQPVGGEYVALADQISFFEFLKQDYQNMESKVLDEIENDSVRICIFIGLHVVGIMLGVTGIAKTLQATYYCDACNKYHKRKSMEGSTPDDIEYFIKQNEEDLFSNQDFLDAIEQAKATTTKKNEYSTLDLSYCPNCFKGYIIVKFFTKDFKGKVTELNNARKTIWLSAVTIKKYLGISKYHQ